MELFSGGETLELLKNVKTGLWKLELERNKPVRFYADELMDSLLGVDHDTSPEERFVFHRRRIHHEDNQLFEQYTENLLKHRHAEVVYRYIHPFKGEMYVRCSGCYSEPRGNTEIIVGYHEDISDSVRLEKSEMEHKMAVQLENLEKRLRVEQVRFRDALTKDALYYYNFDVSTGIVREEIVSETMENPIQKLGLVLPISYDKLNETLEKKYVLKMEEDSNRELWTRMGLMRAYHSGKRILEMDYYSLLSNSYLKATILLAENENNGHIDGIYICKDVSVMHIQEQREKTYQKLTMQYMDNFADAIFSINVDTGEFDIYSSAGFGQNFEDCPNVESAFVKLSENVVQKYKERFLKNCALEQIKSKLMESDRYSFHTYFVDNHGKIARKTYWFYATDEKHNLVLAVCEDSTAEFQREKTLAEAVKKAKEANAAKTNFLFNMSHDIRTPMNAIMGFTNLLEKKHQDEESTRYISNIKTSSDYLLNIIDNVLEMARIESGNVELKEELMDLNRIDHNLSVVFENEYRKHELFSEHSVFLNHTDVYGDLTKYREICINIISNAIKYTPAGGTISLLVDELPSDNKEYMNCRIQVRDTGIGISKEFLPHIFDSFSRERTVTENRISGTGLGMGIVKRYVEIMNGSIEVDSELGHGTCVTVVIPFRIADATVHEEREKVQDELDISLLQGKRLLMAEDNELNAEIAMAILMDMGLEVEWAQDGQICINMLKEAKDDYYDAVIMDVQMPNMDGYQATREIRSLDDCDKAEITIIAMTANAFAEDRRNALDAGMDDFIAKPINVVELKQVLIKHLI